MKKIIKLMFSVAVLSALAGCLEYEPGTERITAPLVTEVPQGGWTEETLTAVCSIDGVPLTQPVTLRDFGMDYRYELPYGTKSLTDPNYPDEMPWCTLEGPAEGYIVQFPRGTLTETLNADTPILSFNAYRYGTERSFYVNGITYGCTEQEAIAALGEPQYRHEGKTADGESFAVTCQYDSSATGEPILSIFFKSENSTDKPALYYIGLDVSGENRWKEARN